MRPGRKIALHSKRNTKPSWLRYAYAYACWSAASGSLLPPDLEAHLAGLEVTAQAEADQRAQYVTSLAALHTRIHTLEQGTVTRAPQPLDVEARLTALEVAAQAEVDRLRNELVLMAAHNSILQQQLEHAQALA